MPSLTTDQTKALECLYDRPNDYIASKDIDIGHPVHITGRILGSLRDLGYAETTMDHKLRVWRITSKGTEYIFSRNSSKSTLHPQSADPDAIIPAIPDSTNHVFFIVTDAQLAHIISSKIDELIPNDVAALHNTIAELNALVIEYKRMYTKASEERDKLLGTIDRVSNTLLDGLRKDAHKD